MLCLKQKTCRFKYKKSMKEKDYIKITKLKACKNPKVETPDKKDYIPGQDNGNVSLPAEYTVEGYLLNDVKIGQIIMIDRVKRNDIETPGLMNTSKITKINGNRIETQNSIYKIEKLNK